MYIGFIGENYIYLEFNQKRPETKLDKFIEGRTRIKRIGGAGGGGSSNIDYTESQLENIVKVIR